MELRARGKTFDQIAEELEYANRSGAFKAVQAGLDRMLREPAERLRKLEDARLSALLEAVMPAAMVGDLGSIDRVLRLSESRRRLWGLDGASRLDVTTQGKAIVPVDWSSKTDDELRKALASRSEKGAH
jgi:hypothetical protein